MDVNNKHPISPQPTPSPKSPMYATSESARSEDDDDDDDDDDEDDSSEEEGEHRPSRTSWESATPQYGAEDDGCKIFVGGIMFDDLEALKKTKDGYSASEEVIAHIQKLKNERLIEIIRIFSRFGTVVRYLFWLSLSLRSREYLNTKYNPMFVCLNYFYLFGANDISG